eukprot:1459395-Prymnesium_polylepis.1
MDVSQMAFRSQGGQVSLHHDPLFCRGRHAHQPRPPRHAVAGTRTWFEGRGLSMRDRARMARMYGAIRAIHMVAPYGDPPRMAQRVVV